MNEEAGKKPNRLEEPTPPKTETAGPDRMESFYFLAEHSNDGILLADSNGKHLYANGRASEITGYTVEELLNTNMRDLAHPDDSKMLFVRLKARFRGEIVPKQYETKIISKDLKPVFIEVTASKTLWNEDTVTLVIFRDVTKRKQAEESLQESELRFKELADSIHDVFFAMDEDLRYTYWNKSSENLTGIRAEEALGKSLLEVFPDTTDIRNAEKIYREVLSTQQPRSFINETAIGAELHYFEITAYPFRNGISVFAKDITKRIHAEEALKESERKLILQNRLLEQKNVALSELMDFVQKEKKRMESNVLSNIEQIVLPLLVQMGSKIHEFDRAYIDLLKDSLSRLTDSMGLKLSSENRNLTRREKEICNMIRGGLSSKEISKLLALSVRTVEIHRKNIRKKLGLTNQGVNLAVHLEEM